MVEGLYPIWTAVYKQCKYATAISSRSYAYKVGLRKSKLCGLPGPLTELRIATMDVFQTSGESWTYTDCNGHSVGPDASIRVIGVYPRG
jgi:hypothetical protein